MEALGINLTWFLFQLGNFIVLLVGLTYLLHKPLMKLLEGRQQEIKEGLEFAEQAKFQLELAKRQQEEALEKARRESTALLQETKQQAKDLEDKLQKDAEGKAQALREKALQDLANEKEQLRAELKAELASMVILATEKVLGQEVKAEEKSKATSKHIKKL